MRPRPRAGRPSSAGRRRPVAAGGVDRALPRDRRARQLVPATAGASSTSFGRLLMAGTSAPPGDVRRRKGAAHVRLGVTHRSAARRPTSWPGSTAGGPRPRAGHGSADRPSAAVAARTPTRSRRSHCDPPRVPLSCAGHAVRARHLCIRRERPRRLPGRLRQRRTQTAVSTVRGAPATYDGSLAEQYLGALGQRHRDVAEVDQAGEAVATTERQHLLADVLEPGQTQRRRARTDAAPARCGRARASRRRPRTRASTLSSRQEPGCGSHGLRSVRAEAVRLRRPGPRDRHPAAVATHALAAGLLIDRVLPSTSAGRSRTSGRPSSSPW